MEEHQSDAEDELLDGFFEHLLNIKMFHFQTKSGFRHLKCDEYLTQFLSKLDRFFEVWQGEYHKIRTKEINIQFTTKNDENFYFYLDFFADWLLEFKNADWPPTLPPIRDDIVADIRKLQYLIKDFK
jgi:hypothetical protein